MGQESPKFIDIPVFPPHGIMDEQLLFPNQLFLQSWTSLHTHTPTPAKSDAVWLPALLWVASGENWFTARQLFGFGLFSPAELQNCPLCRQWVKCCHWKDAHGQDGSGGGTTGWSCVLLVTHCSRKEVGMTAWQISRHYPGSCILPVMGLSLDTAKLPFLTTWHFTQSAAF